MPRTEQVLSIFLASPGDVSEERRRVKDVVDTWNTSWSRELSVRLDLLQWETDAYPDAGDDAQDVINRQIPDDWDLFIGLMWCRFGTPTARAGSGTEEEFQRAVDRRNTADSRVALLLYFKDGPIAPSKIDPTQLAGVRSFQDEARSLGLLTWSFNDADDFERLLSVHITKHVQEWRRAANSVVQPRPPVKQQSTSTVPADPQSEVSKIAQARAESEDDGYLDLFEEFSTRSTEIQEISERLNAAQNHLTEKTNEGRLELERLGSGPNPGSHRAFRASIAKVAEEMLAYAKIVNDESPRFRLAMDKSMSALLKLMNISGDLFPDQLSEAKTAAFVLLQTLAGSRTAIQGFRDSTIALPKMSKEINAAKRRQAEALAGLISEFERAERLLSEGIAAIGAIASQAED